MRICIVAHGYTGATLPLAHHLAKAGHEVTCYYLFWAGTESVESLDFGMKLKATTYLHRLDAAHPLYNYMDRRVRVMAVPLLNPSGTGGMKRRLREHINGLHTRCIARRIAAEGYDLVNVLAYTAYDTDILAYLHSHRQHCCISLHEVFTSLTDRTETLPAVARALRLGTEVVVHSQRTLDDLLEATGDMDIAGRIHLIHFGAFESYRLFGNGTPVNGCPQDFLLYVGFIKPYKGLRYLQQAVDGLDDIADLHVVVAGSGWDDALPKMQEDRHFTVVNRFIGNGELVWLMQHCRAVVCPYIAASQSGLVQTAMVFGKPLIATRTGAFEDLIHDGENGYLAQPADAASLADGIRRLYTGPEMQLVPAQELDWDSIAGKYLGLIRNS